jgi:hypothetical protein
MFLGLVSTSPSIWKPGHTPLGQYHIPLTLISALTHKAGVNLYSALVSDYIPCTLNNTNTSDGPMQVFYNILDELEPANDTTYDLFYYYLLPMMTVYLPIANAERLTNLGEAKAMPMCMHIDHINPGSRVPPTLPSPTPINYNKGKLTGGDIAGIVVGCVAGVALIAGLVFWLWRRQRKQKKARQQAQDGQHPGYPDDKKAGAAGAGFINMPEAPADSAVSELYAPAGGAFGIRPELPERKSGPRVELEAEEAQLGTIPEVQKTYENPVELEAGIANGNGRNERERPTSITQTPAEVVGPRK